MFERIGVLAYRLRYLIVIVWAIAAVLSVTLAPSLASAGAADQAAFLPGYAPSVQAADALERGFPGAAASSSATLTFSREAGLRTRTGPTSRASRRGRRAPMRPGSFGTP